MRLLFVSAFCLLPTAYCVAATTQPATQPVITPEAQQVLTEVRGAYAKLKTLTLAGTLSLDLEVGGQTQTHSASFTAAYLAPSCFRHEMKDDLLLGASGKEFYAWQASEGRYFHHGQDEAAGNARLTLAQVPGPVARALKAQDPSLALALAADAGRQLIGQATHVARGADVKLDGCACQALEMRTAEGSAVALVDGQTHLLRRLSVDGAAGLARRRGTDDVKKDLLVFDYTTSGVDAAVPAGQFTFVPPAQARDAAPPGSDEEAAPSAALEGKAAPAFTLTDLSGKTVSLAELKGSVVVLDFWATWCPPCVASLPHLDRVYLEKKDQGLLVFAVNVHEDPAKVRAFVEKLKLHMPVLLDTQQTNVADAYQVTGIPQTVVIGKDATVKKVLVGYDPENGEDKLHEAIEAAMGE